jgi:hypothetical protein
MGDELADGEEGIIRGIYKEWRKERRLCVAAFMLMSRSLVTRLWHTHSCHPAPAQHQTGTIG